MMQNKKIDWSNIHSSEGKNLGTIEVFRAILREHEGEIPRNPNSCNLSCFGGKRGGNRPKTKPSFESEKMRGHQNIPKYLNVSRVGVKGRDTKIIEIREDVKDR